MANRELVKPLKIWTRFLCICIPLVGIFGIFDILMYLKCSVYIQQYLAIILGLVLAVVFLQVPPAKKAKSNLFPWYDIVLSFLGLFIGIYPALFYPELIITIGLHTPFKIVLSILAILLILESCRRYVGWPLTIIVIILLIYPLLNFLLPGALEGTGVSWKQLVIHCYLDQGALFGIALRVTATIVLAFVLFGQMLFKTGGGEFISDLALSTMGRYRGGPAKASIVASSAFGTLSGSAVANVATTGVITIPLMTRTGYPPYYAAAVESTASTGGQIAPPVMGAAAFLMAEFLGIPYPEVVISALIPAVLYYIALFIQVDLGAASRDIKGLSPQELPLFKKVFMEGWPFLFPFIVLVYTLFIMFLEPDMAGIYSVAAIILLQFIPFKRATGIKIKKLLKVLEATGGSMIEITLVCAAAGLILGVVNISGLGFSFSAALIQFSEGNFLILLLLSAGAAIILGMGMTVTAAYILVVTLLVPALTKMGMYPLAAHLFVFYFACLSFLTPPICLAVYTAASISNTGAMKVALQAIRLGIAAYIIPFIFAISPELLMNGSAFDIGFNVVSSILGISFVAVGLEGFLLHKCSIWERFLFILSGLGLLMPFWTFRLSGIIILLILFSLQLVRKKRT